MCEESAFCANDSAIVARTLQLKFLHKSGIMLCLGGTPDISRWRIHRGRRKHPSSPGGATDRFQSVAPPGLRMDFSKGSGGYAALHHRLISTAPPAQRHA